MGTDDADSSPRPVPWRHRLRAALRAPYRHFFGEDFFITYARADSAGYAAALANRLFDEGHTCFLDQWHPVVDEKIPPSILRALRHASTQVVIASPAAAVSSGVAQEVELFAATGRPVVPIDVAGALADASWALLTRGIARSVEPTQAIANGLPADHVVRRLVDTFGYRRRSLRVRWSLGTFALASGVAAGIGFWQASVAEGERQSAVTARADAQREARAAQAAASVAEDQRQRREQALLDLRKQEVIAADNARRADEQASAAEARGRLADSRALAINARTQPLATDQRLLLAAHAWRLDPNDDARAALMQALQQAGSLQRTLYAPSPTRMREVVGVGLSPDASLAVAGYADGSLVAWRVGDGHAAGGAVSPPRDPGRRGTKAAYAAHGGWAAIGHADAGVDLVRWEGGRWNPRHAVVPPTDPVPRLPVIVSALAFSTDGRQLAVGWSDGAVRVFDTGQPADPGVRLDERFDALRDPHRLGVLAAAFSPDGSWLVTTHGGGTVKLWRAGALPVLARSLAMVGDVSGIAFDPTGRELLLAAGREGRLQRVAVPALDPVPWPAAKPTGRWTQLLAAAGGDEVVVQALGEPLRALGREGPARLLAAPPLHEGAAMAAAAAAARVVVGLPDGTLEIHALDRRADARPLLTAPGGRRIAFDDRGTQLFAVGQAAHRWLVDGPAAPRPLSATWDPMRTQLLMVEAAVGGVRVLRSDQQAWRCGDRACRAEPRAPATTAPDNIWQDSEATGAWLLRRRDAALACDARRCVALPGAAAARRLALSSRTPHWAYATDREVKLCVRKRCLPVPALEPGSDGWVGALAFAPDGHMLVTATSDGRVRFFASADGRALAPASAQQAGAITRIVFDRAGRLMATGGRAGTVQLWNVIERSPIGQPVSRPGGAQVVDLALAPAGDRLAVLYSDGGVELRDLDTALLQQRACAIANRALTLDEWRSIGGGANACPAVCPSAGGRCGVKPVRASVAR